MHQFPPAEDQAYRTYLTGLLEGHIGKRYEGFSLQPNTASN